MLVGTRRSLLLSAYRVSKHEDAVIAFERTMLNRRYGSGAQCQEPSRRREWRHSTSQSAFVHSPSTRRLRLVRHKNEKIFCAIPKPRLTRGFCP